MTEQKYLLLPGYKNSSQKNTTTNVHFAVLSKKYHHKCPLRQKLANRIRERFAELDNVEEKKMMGGLTFMYNSKMCVGIIKDELMCRIDPSFHEKALEKHGCRTMDFTKRPMKGYVMIDETGIKSEKDFEYWISLSLDFNKKAKASKKK